MSARIRASEASLLAAERCNANETAALLEAMNSLTTSMSRDDRKYRSPPEHV